MAARELFPGSTELHGLVRSKDWRTTPLGATESWAPSLVTQVRTVLSSRYPMILAWGDEYTQIYNDGYSQLIGSKHPGDVGADLRQSLAEGWDVLGPLVEAAKETGVPTWIPQLQLLLERGGYREESYFAVSHAPAFGDDGEVAGMHAVCNEVTEQVLSERRLTLLQELSLRAATTVALTEAYETCISVLSQPHLDLPFVQLYSNQQGSLQYVGGTGQFFIDTPQWLEGADLEESTLFDLPPRPSDVLQTALLVRVQLHKRQVQVRLTQH